MAGCPFNKWKECKKEDCQLYRTIMRYAPDSSEPDLKTDCVFNLTFEVLLDYLHQIRDRNVGIQKATEQVRNIFNKMLCLAHDRYERIEENRIPQMATRSSTSNR